MSKSEPERAFHTPRWVAGLIAVGAVGLSIAAVHYYRSEGASLGFAISSALAVVAIVGIADALTTSVRLYPDSLSIRTSFRRRVVPRSELEHVTWAGGVGVSVRLKSGGWVQLPDVGNSQSVTNSIRAWIKRSPESA